MKIVFNAEKQMELHETVTATIVATDYNEETSEVNEITVEMLKFNKKDTFTWRLYINQFNFDNLLSYVSDKQITSKKQLDKVFKDMIGKEIQLEKTVEDNKSSYTIM